MRRVVSTVLGLAVLAGLGFAVNGDDKPKFTTKQVMAKANGKGKNSLANKVIGGKASDAEKKQLVELFEAMSANKPPMGSEESWKKLNDELVGAAKDAEAGKEGAGDRLKKANNCKVCHEAHKPS